MSFFNKIFGKKTDSSEKLNESTPINELNYIKNLNTKYFRNLELIVDYDISIDCYCDIFETWNDKPLNSNLTYIETHKTIKKILKEEYNEVICEKIKYGIYTEEEAAKIVNNLDAQFDRYKKECEYTKELENSLLHKFTKGESDDAETSPKA